MGVSIDIWHAHIRSHVDIILNVERAFKKPVANVYMEPCPRVFRGVGGLTIKGGGYTP